MSYIVQIEEGIYLAPWSGDPGRTCRETSAKQYKDIAAATYALARARKYNEFLGAIIEPALARHPEEER